MGKAATNRHGLRSGGDEVIRCRGTRFTLALALATAISAPAFAACEPRVPIVLPATLRPAQASYEAEVDGAIARVRQRFSAWGFGVSVHDLVDRVVVFATNDEARRDLARRSGAPLAQMPTHVGGLADGRDLLVVAREVYHGHWPVVHPGVAWTEAEYGRLLVHELGHRAHAHVAIQLAGSEEGMGPRWFYEGLAVEVAGQFADPPGAVDGWDRQAFEALVARAASPAGLPYATYGRMVRRLAQATPVGQLIREATQPGFPGAAIDRAWPVARP
jgi:hypothetical protein